MPSPCSLDTYPTNLLDLTRDACALAGWGPGQRVVDLGCGDGASLRYLRRDLGASAFGIDLLRPQGREVVQARAESLRP